MGISTQRPDYLNSALDGMNDLFDRATICCDTAQLIDAETIDYLKVYFRNLKTGVVNNDPFYT